MGEGIPVGRIFGISIRIHISWFIIFALMIWAFTATFPVDWGMTMRITAAVITSLLMFVSVLAHELMHSLVAIRNNIPVKAITLFIFGGVSQISSEPQQPGVEFRVAIAGPLTSLLLGGAFWGLFYVLPSSLDVVLGIVNWLGWINLTLGAFNLIPAFPMDGGRVLRSIIWWRTHNLRRATQIAAGAGKVVAVIFIIGGIYLFFRTIYGLNGLWLALIGWFLYNAASNSYRQMVLQQTLQGHEVREIMSRECTMISPDMSVEELVNGYVLPTGKRCFIVTSGSSPQGMVTLQEIKGVPQEDRRSKAVSQIMKSVSQLKTVSPDEDLSTVMRLLTERNVNQLPVVEKGELVGMIARENLLNFINLSESTKS